MNMAGRITVDQAESINQTEGASVWSNWFTPGKVVVLITFLLFIQYPEVFLGTHSFFNNDFGLFTYPTIHHLRDSLLRGEIPRWNPLNDCGVPFLAQWNTCACYPPAWLCVALPLPWSLNMLCLGHLVLAGYGMYLLAFRWTGHRFASSLAAIAFALNGFTFNCLMWISNMGALGWMPMTILLVERAWREGGRFLIWAGLVATMQMLSGAPEIILMTWLILGTLCLSQVVMRLLSARSSLMRLSVVVAIVAGVCAIQLLPFFELVSQSDRRAAEGSAAWSMPSWGLANFVVPLFRCARSILGPYFQIDQQWTTSFYPGIIVLLLALVAVWIARSSKMAGIIPASAGTQAAARFTTWFLFGWAVFGVLLALGDHFFLYPLLKRVFPAFGFVRYPIKFLVPTIFALPLLAALAAAWICESASVLPARKLLVTIGSVLLLSAVGVVLVSRFFPYREEVSSVTARNGFARAAVLLVGLALLGFVGKETRFQRILALSFLALLGLDAITHVPRQNPTVSVRAYDALDLGMSEPPALGKSRAMVSRGMQAMLEHAAVPDPLAYYIGNRRSLFEDCNLTENIPKINGFFSLHLQNQAAVNALIYDPSNSPVGLADFLGVTRISSATEFWKWDARPSALPLVTAGQQAIFSEPAVILKALANPEFDGRKRVHLPEAARNALADVRPGSVKIDVIEFTAHTIRLQAEAESPTLVVVAQSHYPEWKAMVDGALAEIWPANYAFQAIRVPGGKHQISLVYRDRGFQLGGLISSVSLAACFAGYWRLRRRS